MKSLYFDYNATTPVLPPVFEAMRPYFSDIFGNPGCAHAYGLEAAEAVEKARARTADLIGAPSGAIFFTSCATESNNIVLHSAFRQFLRERRGRVVVSAVEHPAVLEPLGRMEQEGLDVVRVPVDGRGVVDLDQLREAIVPGTVLVSVMLANNETGAIQPVAEIARLARERGALAHTDAAQAVGKIPVDVEALGVDLLTIAGHKLYAPKGVGALYVRPGVALAPLTYGGGQERGLRPGTENVPYMVALGQACADAARDLPSEAARQEELGRLLLGSLEDLRRDLGLDWTLHAADAPRLPNTMSIGFRNHAAGDILSALVGLDVAVSGGAACHAGQVSVSHVLKAMSVPMEYAAGTIRFSWGRPTGTDEVRELGRRIEMAFEMLRT